MDNFTHEEITRTVGVLVEQLNIKTRADFVHKLDDGTGAQDIEGIGEERSAIVRALWRLSDGDWVQYTGLPLAENVASDQSQVIRVGMILTGGELVQLLENTGQRPPDKE